MEPAPPGLDVNGDPPDLRGLRCDALLCDEYRFQGKLENAANVVYLYFGGSWHRLYFDWGIVFWRPYHGPPEAVEPTEDGAAFPLVDLAARFGLAGVRLRGYRMEPLPLGARVTFEFENGVALAFRNEDDRTTYDVHR
ncbi:MAG TPA: hypothetical protein VFX98_08985 [Longimicrobiaceae bacterium]|nr:hypothetical protein [Longimicrobiaceae bacterium]